MNIRSLSSGLTETLTPLFTAVWVLLDWLIGKLRMALLSFLGGVPREQLQEQAQQPPQPQARTLSHNHINGRHIRQALTRLAEHQQPLRAQLRHLGLNARRWVQSLTPEQADKMRFLSDEQLAQIIMGEAAEYDPHVPVAGSLHQPSDHETGHDPVAQHPDR